MDHVWTSHSGRDRHQHSCRSDVLGSLLNMDQGGGSVVLDSVHAHCATGDLARRDVQPKVVAWAEYAPQETQWSPALFRQWQQNRTEYRAKILEEMDVWAAGKVESKFRLIDVTDGSQGTDPESQTDPDGERDGGPHSGLDEHEAVLDPSEAVEP